MCMCTTAVSATMGKLLKREDFYKSYIGVARLPKPIISTLIMATSTELHIITPNMLKEL